MLVNFDNDVDVNDWEGRLTPPPLITFATSMLETLSHLLHCHPRVMCTNCNFTPQ